MLHQLTPLIVECHGCSFCLRNSCLDSVLVILTDHVIQADANVLRLRDGVEVIDRKRGKEESLILERCPGDDGYSLKDTPQFPPHQPPVGNHQEPCKTRITVTLQPTTKHSPAHLRHHILQHPWLEMLERLMSDYLLRGSGHRSWLWGLGYLVLCGLLHEVLQAEEAEAETKSGVVV